MNNLNFCFKELVSKITDSYDLPDEELAKSKPDITNELVKVLLTSHMTGYQAKELTYFQHFVVDQEYLKTFSANDIKKMYNEYKQKKNATTTVPEKQEQLNENYKFLFDELEKDFFPILEEREESNVKGIDGIIVFHYSSSEKLHDKYKKAKTEENKELQKKLYDNILNNTLITGIPLHGLFHITKYFEGNPTFLALDLDPQGKSQSIKALRHEVEENSNLREELFILSWHMSYTDHIAEDCEYCSRLI